MGVTLGLSSSPSEIVGLLCSRNGQGRGAGLMVGSGPNGHVPFSICVDAAVDVTSVAERAKATPRLVIRFQKVKSATRTNTRWLNWGYVGIDIVLVVLSVAVGVMMGDGFI